MDRDKTVIRIMPIAKETTPWWAWAWPVLAWVVLIAAALLGTGGIVATIAGIVLIATVFAAVYHAEAVAHCTGEPFGTWSSPSPSP
jgi:Ca2+:H+ antiporter